MAWIAVSLVTLLLTVGLLIALRGVALWYWRIPDLLEEQSRVVAEIRGLRSDLSDLQELLVQMHQGSGDGDEE